MQLRVGEMVPISKEAQEDMEDTLYDSTWKTLCTGRTDSFFMSEGYFKTNKIEPFSEMNME